MPWPIVRVTCLCLSPPPPLSPSGPTGPVGFPFPGTHHDAHSEDSIYSPLTPTNPQKKRHARAPRPSHRSRKSPSPPKKKTPRARDTNYRRAEAKRSVCPAMSRVGETR